MFTVLKIFINYYNKNTKYITQTIYFTDEYHCLITLTINQTDR